MNVVHTIAETRARRAELTGKVALVPTMGALHVGHLSLIARAKELAQSVVVSIFVNPTQFGPRDDFNKYPRPIMADLEKCKAAGVDVVFNPGTEELYKPGTSDVVVDLPLLTTVLEGKHRPGHFKGVCQVVTKLFHIVQPNVACFGQKDFQQFRVLQAMVEALDFPIEMIACPTLRERDGLAMSSRNQYLLPEERQRALSISRALNLAAGEVKEGVKQTNRLLATMQNVMLDKGTLGRIPVSIDYVAAVDPVTLKNVETVTGPTVLAIAARVGQTRLIDNIVVEPATP
jgi:pantoate--beta-alanine ligase